MNIRKKDEFAHTPSDHPLWRESHYFNFYDKKQDVGGFTAIGVMPNKGMVEAGMVIVRDNKLIYAYPFEGTLEGGWDDLCFGGLSYKPIKPMSSWNIALEDEDVKIDLTFKKMNPIFDYGEGSEVLTKYIGTRHYEHSGKVKGTIAIGDEVINFSGFGERDHSWGIRDWHGCESWVWFSAQFGRELAFNGWYGVVKGKKYIRGYVFDGKDNYSIDDIEIQTNFEEDKKTQKSMRFELTDSEKRTYSVDAEALIVIPILKVSEGYSTLINEALSRFTFESKIGFGVTEYLWTERCL